MDFKRIMDMLQNDKYWVESIKIQRVTWDIIIKLRRDTSRVKFVTNYAVFDKFKEDSLKAIKLLKAYGKLEDDDE